MQYFESHLAFSEITSYDRLPVFNLIDFWERKYWKLLIDRKVEFISAMQRNLCYKLKLSVDVYHCARGTVKNWKMQQFKEVKSQNLEINFISGGQHKHPIPCWLGSFFFPKMLSVALIRGYTLFHGDDITETKCLLRTQVLKTLLYRVCVSIDWTILECF